MSDTSPEPTPVTSGEVISEPELSGTWLPPAGAAARLGISERTLRRHIDEGRYHKRIVRGRAEVLVPGSGDVAANLDTGSEIAVPDAPVREIMVRLDRQALTVTRQAIQIARLTDRLKATERQLVEAEQRLAEERGRAADAIKERDAERAKSWWAKIFG